VALGVGPAVLTRSHEEEKAQGGHVCRCPQVVRGRDIIINGVHEVKENFDREWFDPVRWGVGFFISPKETLETQIRAAMDV
jgi:hypothetical protein